MDTTTDLAARAAAFIGVIQQLCVDHPEYFCEQKQVFNLLTPSDTTKKVLLEKAVENEKFVERAVQVIWINNEKATRKAVAESFLKREFELLDWVWKDSNLAILKDEQDKSNPLPSPEQWRNKFCRLLYLVPRERSRLAKAINYLPMYVVLAAGAGSKCVLTQRMMQEWHVEDAELEVILTKRQLSKCRANKIADEIAESFLQDDELLVKSLKKFNVPLPYEYILKEELDEIKRNRKQRAAELVLIAPGLEGTPSDDVVNQAVNVGPLDAARSMRLHALAFSGGGIRSATFNLGILQGLARAGMISKFDYLSTVSGGGYIGSWFAAWIKREGSVLKVSDRLNSRKSSDPLAEEVRPIRWLRMYSNYLTPRAGIMSVDSWTVGMTVLRNMLLNQVLILLMLFTLLLFGRAIFLFWENEVSALSGSVVFIISTGLIFVASVIAGIGMRFYSKAEDDAKIKIIAPGRRKWVSASLLAISVISAVLVSAWFFKNPYASAGTGFFDLLAPALIVFAGLLLVAILGRYDSCIPARGPKKGWGYFLVFLFSGLAALAGWIFFALAWRLITIIQNKTFAGDEPGFPDFGNALAFTFGTPIILEAVSLTIVVRMALLGVYFPDERREWWGRMGGMVHRISFLWILVAGSALVGNMVIFWFFNENAGKIIAAAGGWAAIVITAVKAAFSPKSSDKEPSMLSKALDILAKAGPYLFALGLLIFLPVLLHSILGSFLSDNQQDDLLTIMLITLSLAVITVVLAWRIGVNEFSMHHFYKNRLVRAFLGATVSRIDRQNKSSHFTGFSKTDDVLLSDLRHSKKYYGPYPILNTTLNVNDDSDLDRQDRKAESFIFSPLYCGFDFSRTRPMVNVNQKSYNFGFRPTEQYAYQPSGPHIGSAMAISGAAANPNQGSHSSPATAFLLTAFNVRLGWWIGNPRKSAWKKSDPAVGLPYLISNLVGKSNSRDDYVCLSDGGHFDNMALYELVRRRTSVIILGDGEQDDKFTCEGLANAIRRCRIDFGVEISIDVTSITNRADNISSKSYEVGTIYYPGDTPFYGWLIYLKSSITNKEPVDVREYSLKNPKFPHQTTGDQFFDECQFESYRQLGISVAESALSDPQVRIALELHDDIVLNDVLKF